jgi:hypothetical protein
MTVVIVFLFKKHKNVLDLRQNSGQRLTLETPIVWDQGIGDCLHTMRQEVCNTIGPRCGGNHPHSLCQTSRSRTQ